MEKTCGEEGIFAEGMEVAMVAAAREAIMGLKG
jgi:hypothetical protein